MVKKDFFHIFFFIVVMLFFALYESAEMTSITYGHLDIATDVVTYKYKIILFLLCAGYSLYYNHSKSKIELTGIFFILLLFIWGISILHHSDDGIVSSAIFSTNMLLPVVMLTYFTNVSRKIPSPVFYTSLILTLLFLFYSFIESYQVMLMYSITDDVKAGISYIFLFLLPFFLLSDKAIIKWGGILFVVGVMVFSLKRGGVVSLSLALIVYYIVGVSVSGKKTKYTLIFSMLFLMSIVFFVLTWFLKDYTDELVLRLMEMGNDGGSARDQVYEVTWRMITESDGLSLCLGHGWNMVIEKSPMELSAHNDFMEVIYDFGIFAFFLYMYLYYRLYKTMIRMVKSRSEYAAPFAFSVITFTVNSTIAHILIYPFNFIAVAAVWGYILGKEKMSIQAFQIAKR